MKTYRIRLDGKVYELEVELIGNSGGPAPESSVSPGERIPYSISAETAFQKAEEAK
jgi:hypothetical protein